MGSCQLREAMHIDHPWFSWPWASCNKNKVEQRGKSSIQQKKRVSWQKCLIKRETLKVHILFTHKPIKIKLLPHF